MSEGGSQTWKTFLHNHAAGIGAMDFLIVPTIGFRLLFVLVILSLSVTDHPTADWIARQLTDGRICQAVDRFNGSASSPLSHSGRASSSILPAGTTF